MTESLKACRLVELDTVGTFADGAAVRRVGANTFKVCQVRPHIHISTHTHTHTLTLSHTCTSTTRVCGLNGMNVTDYRR